MWVEWKDFVTALNKYIQVDDEANKLLQYTLGNQYRNSSISNFKTIPILDSSASSNSATF